MARRRRSRRSAIAYSDGERRIDVGWYGDMTFLPHLWSLMKRGGVECHIAFGEVIESSGKDRKTLAAETRARVRELLASVDALRGMISDAANSAHPREARRARLEG